MNSPRNTEASIIKTDTELAMVDPGRCQRAEMQLVVDRMDHEKTRALANRLGYMVVESRRSPDGSTGEGQVDAVEKLCLALHDLSIAIERAKRELK